MIKTILALIILQYFQLMIIAAKKAKQLKLRPKMPMNQVKLNSFLFKRTKRYQSEQTDLTESNDHLDQSLRFRFRSEVSPVNRSMRQTTKCFDNRDKKGIRKNSSTDLTFRILKWSSLKNKIQRNQTSFHNTKCIQPNIQRIKDSVRINYKLQNQTNKSLQLNKFPHKKSDSETERIIQNYKFTQRIVFLEQVQQKKMRQFELQHQISKQKTFRVKNKEEEPKEFKKIVHGDGSRVNTQCRPWSSKSIISIIKN